MSLPEPITVDIDSDMSGHCNFTVHIGSGAPLTINVTGPDFSEPQILGVATSATLSDDHPAAKMILDQPSTPQPTSASDTLAAPASNVTQSASDGTAPASNSTATPSAATPSAAPAPADPSA